MTKKIDDTNLEWYGLTEKDIENIKNEKDFTDGDIMIDAMKLSTIFSKIGYNIDLEDIISLLEKNKINEKVQANIW